jgi:hypothetical protein
MGYRAKFKSTQDTIRTKIDVYWREMNVFALVFRSIAGIQGVDLTKNILKRSLISESLCTIPSWTSPRKFAGLLHNKYTIAILFDRGRTCLRCWSNNLDPSYRSLRDLFSILACAYNWLDGPLDSAVWTCLEFGFLFFKLFDIHPRGSGRRIRQSEMFQKIIIPTFPC